jgi:hypothetical protein
MTVMTVFVVAFCATALLCLLAFLDYVRICKRCAPDRFTVREEPLESRDADSDWRWPARKVGPEGRARIDDQDRWASMTPTTTTWQCRNCGRTREWRGGYGGYYRMILARQEPMVHKPRRVQREWRGGY